MSRTQTEIIQLLESIIRIANDGIKSVNRCDDIPGSLYDELLRIDILLDEALLDALS